MIGYRQSVLLRPTRNCVDGVSPSSTTYRPSSSSSSSSSCSSSSSPCSSSFSSVGGVGGECNLLPVDSLTTNLTGRCLRSKQNWTTQLAGEREVYGLECSKLLLLPRPPPPPLHSTPAPPPHPPTQLPRSQRFHQTLPISKH